MSSRLGNCAIAYRCLRLGPIVLMAALSSPTMASSVSGVKIVKIAVSGGGYARVVTTGTKSTCATDWQYSVDAGTVAGQAALSALMAAKNSGGLVDIVGWGTPCDSNGVEQLQTVVIY